MVLAALENQKYFPEARQYWIFMETFSTEVVPLTCTRPTLSQYLKKNFELKSKVQRTLIVLYPPRVLLLRVLHLSIPFAAHINLLRRYL
jgi:hypothetical protein